MPDEGSELAKEIARAYRASGIAAKAHGGMLFIERREGWEGPVEPSTARSTYADDLRAIASEVRVAASQVVDGLNDNERSFSEQRSGYMPMYLTDPERYTRLGYDDRTALRYVAVVIGLSLWKEFQP